MRLFADDDVRRVNAVWLGPHGYTLPFAARYSAWVVCAVIFGLIVLFEAVTPMSVSTVPVWEAMIAMVATTWLMTLVNHDTPIGSVLADFRTELSGPRDRNPETCYQPLHRRVRVRETKPDA